MSKTLTSLDACLEEPAFAADPFPYLASLRQSAPIQWSETWQCWVLSRYAEVREVLQDTTRFSNHGRITGLLARHYSPDQLVQLRPLINHYAHGLINDDPPDHTRMRRILHGVFKPSVIAQLDERVQALVNRLLDTVAEEGKIDFVRQFTHPLPVQVVAEAFGVPQGDVPRLIKWSHGIVAFQQYALPPFAVTLKSQTALLEMRTYLREQIARRRKMPAEDILGLMVSAELEGNSLSEEEILGTAVTIINGGHETTTRFIATAVLDLWRHPKQRTWLQEHPEQMPLAVEELLRFSGPFQRDARVCKQDTVVAGQSIRTGETLMLLLGAANRDPAQFAQPDRLDLTRKPNKHLAFGYGPHICLGAHLARLETGIALTSLLERFPGYRPATDSLTWNFGFVWGPEELPLILT